MCPRKSIGHGADKIQKTIEISKRSKGRQIF